MFLPSLLSPRCPARVSFIFKFESRGTQSFVDYILITLPYPKGNFPSRLVIFTTRQVSNHFHFPPVSRSPSPLRIASFTNLQRVYFLESTVIVQVAGMRT